MMPTGDTPLTLFSSPDEVRLRAVAAGFDAARLTQARLAKGMSKAILSKKIGVTAAAVGQYEARVVQPRMEILPALASALDVPVEYFATGRPFGRVDGTQAHFRSLRSTTSKQRAKAVAFIEQVWELTFALEKRVQFPALDLPLGKYSDPIVAADALRLHWAAGDKPLKHLVATVEASGVIVSLLTLTDTDVAHVDAFSTSHLERPVVVVTPERAKSVFVFRFTIAHELGHLLLHHDTAPGDPQQEREADQFAAQLLTPREILGNLLPRSVNISRLDELSRLWGVSVESLLIRTKELGVASETSIRRGYQRLNQLRSAGLNVLEPVNAYPGEVPSLLKDAAAVAFDEGYSLLALANDLRWKPARVREVLGEADTRPLLRIV